MSANFRKGEGYHQRSYFLLRLRRMAWKLAVLLFAAAAFGGVFYLTFHIIGPCLSRLLARGIAWLADAADGALTVLDVGPLLHGLVREGVFAGVGSVAAFLPVILALFFFLSLLEDTGYLARVAFVMDRPLRRLGLSGQSAVPLLLGFGCSVPGVLAARTLPTRRTGR